MGTDTTDTTGTTDTTHQAISKNVTEWAFELEQDNLVETFVKTQERNMNTG